MSVGEGLEEAEGVRVADEEVLAGAEVAVLACAVEGVDVVEHATLLLAVESLGGVLALGGLAELFALDAVAFEDHVDGGRGNLGAVGGGGYGVPGDFDLAAAEVGGLDVDGGGGQVEACIAEVFGYFAAAGLVERGDDVGVLALFAGGVGVFEGLALGGGLEGLDDVAVAGSW